MFRSTAPSLSAVQPSEAAVIRRSSSSTRAATASAVSRELVDLALVQRGQRLAGHVPLVEQEEGGPAGGAAAERHTSSSIARSTLLTSTPHICSSALATCPWTSSASWGSTVP